MPHYPRSLNYLGADSAFDILAYGMAGWVQTKPGYYRRPSDLAASRAGVVADLTMAAHSRQLASISGQSRASADAMKARARDYLAFARDARKFLTV